MNLVAPKAAAKHERLLNIQVAGQSEIEIIAMTVKNFVTPKAAAKHELLFNKPTSGAQQTNFITIDI